MISVCCQPESELHHLGRSAAERFGNPGQGQDTKGISPPLKYTKDDHRGMPALRAFSCDFQAKKFAAYGQYADYDWFIK